MTMDVSATLADPEMGYTPYTVRRTTYRRRKGITVPVEQYITATGCIHAGTPEMVQLLPKEEQNEDFVVIYTGFALSDGERTGGAVCNAPDRIEWNGETWRVVHVKDWSMFDYYQGLAVRMRA